MYSPAATDWAGPSDDWGELLGLFGIVLGRKSMGGVVGFVPSCSKEN